MDVWKLALNNLALMTDDESLVIDAKSLANKKLIVHTGIAPGQLLRNWFVFHYDKNGIVTKVDLVQK